MSVSLLPSEKPDCGKFIAGGTRFNLRAWEQVTHDKVILGYTQGVKIDFVNWPEQWDILSEFRHSEKARDLISREILALQEKGVLEETRECEGQYLSNVFIRPKPNGKVRLIIDLSDLKVDLEYKHFKMENLQTAIDLCVPGCFLGSLDLSDVYYSVPVHEEDRKYLRFRWGEKTFQYTCLPNGLAQAPRKFTKILKPVFGKLQQDGHSCFGYIDDTFVMGETFEGCLNSLNKLRELLIALGFKIHPTKSVFKPVQEITFLGYIINSVEMTVRPTQEKVEKMIRAILELKGKIRARIREIAGIGGLMVDYVKGVEYGKAHYRHLEINKIKGLAWHKGNFEAEVKISESARKDLAWWEINFKSAFRRIWISVPGLVLTTDASGSGWGAVFGENKTNGRWDQEEREEHINILELKAVLFGLKSFCRDYRGSRSSVK